MGDATIRFFPVGNGDCTLLWVGETRILIDLSPRLESGDPHYDVEETREQLLPLLKRDDGRYVADAFLISHPHKDHVLEAEKLLHLGHPDKYDAADKKILVEEIIYVPASFDANMEHLSDDAKAVLKEIERRLEEDSSAGNMVTALIGPNGEDPGADRVFSVGDSIETFGGSGSDERLAAVVYAPRGVLDPKDRNEVSGVVQFRVTPSGSVNPVRIIMGGDAPWEVWEDIREKEDLEEFTYDLLLAPHHCSWRVFASSSDQEASEKVVELFKQCQDLAKVVSSSFAIDIESRPPSEEAAKIYREIVGDDNFYCTGEYPNEDELQPIVFEISGYGVALQPLDEDDGGDRAATAATLIRSTPQKYGK
jgi:hypothetical protein